MGVQENVDIKATADTNAALTALQQINANLEKLHQTASRTSEKTESMFDGFSKAGQAVQGLLGIGSAMQGMSTAMSLVNAEWDNYIAKQRNAANAQITFAEAQRRMANQLHDMNLDAATARVMAMGKATGVKPSVLAMAMEGTLGSLGAGQPDELAFGAMEASARYRPGFLTGPDELSSFAQGVTGIRKLYPNMSDSQAAAAMSTMMRLDRSTSAIEFTTNVLPGILGRAAAGNGTESLEQLAAMPIALGQVSHDRTGRTTRSAMGSIDKQLSVASAKFFGGRTPSIPERDKFLFETQQGEQVRRDLLGPLFGGGDVGDLTDPGNPMVQEFVARMAGYGVKLHAENKQFPALRQWLNGEQNNQMKQTLADTQRDLGDLSSPRALADFNAREAAIGRNPFQRTATSARAIESGVSAFELANETAGVGRDALQKLLLSRGTSALMQKIILAGFDARTATAGNADDTLDAEITAVESARAYPAARFIGTPMGAGGTTVTSPLTKSQEKTNEILDGILEVLREQRGMSIKVDLGDGPTERGQMSAPQRAGQ